MTSTTTTRKSTKNTELPVALITKRRVTNAPYTAITPDGVVIATNSNPDALAERVQRTHAVAFEVKIKAPKKTKPVQKAAPKASKKGASVQADKPVKQERKLVVKPSPNDGYAFTTTTCCYLPVFVSFIHSARYNVKTGSLLVNIANRGEIYSYEYEDVPETIYHKLMMSRSPGRVYNYAVKGVYTSKRIA